MSETDRLAGSWDVEHLLADALRPIEPPERLSGRVEDTLAAVTQAAAEEFLRERRTVVRQLSLGANEV